MSNYREEDLFNMSDEELIKVFQETRREVDSEEDSTEIEVTETNDSTVESDVKDDVGETEIEVSNVEDPSTNPLAGQVETSTQTNEDIIQIDDLTFTKDELKNIAKNYIKTVNTTKENPDELVLLSSLANAGLTQQDLNLLIDAKKGNKAAIATLLKTNEIDPYDLNDEELVNGYTPNNYAKSYEDIKVEREVNRLMADESFPTTNNLINSLDTESKNFIYASIDNLKAFHEEVSSGTFNKVYPYAKKLALLDGNRQPLLRYYKDASEVVLQSEQQKQPTENGNNSNELRNQRLAASLPKNRGNLNSTISTEFDDSDEAYWKWYNNLQTKY